jgi:hypothetical protein
MANTHTMRFTALPNGLAKTSDFIVPVVSAHAAFRLVPDQPQGILEDFPAASSWPTQPLAFELLFRRGDNTFKTSGLVASAAADPMLWSRLFRPDLAVRRYDPPGRKQRRIRTFRNGRLADRWRDAYVDVVASIGPTNDHLPVGADPAAGLLSRFEAAGLWDADRKKRFGDEQLSSGLEAVLEASGFVPHAPPGDLSPEEIERRDLLEFQRFLTRQLAPDPADTGVEPGDRPDRVSWVKAPTLEFHEVTTACAAHPSLLRRLGFVFDLAPDVAWPVIARSLGGYPDAVSVVAASPGIPPDREPIDLETVDPLVDGPTPLNPAFVSDPSTWTRCRSTEISFAAAPVALGDLTVGGFLRLGDPTRFRAEILDVEATTLKAVGVGGTIQLRHRRRSRSTPERETTPTMRASGIGILRTDRARRVHEGVFQRGDGIVDALSSDPTTIVLEADDVVRGFRLDVMPEKSTRWQSLVRRTGVLELSDGGEPVALHDAEGWVSDGPASDDAGELYLGEEQFRWDGWSPVAPKPGRVIDPEDGVDEPSIDELPGIPAVARYRPTEGTLVPLRYGRRYRFRARAVDIAGNGPEPEAESKPDEETPLVLFGRLDPVGSPDVVMTAPRLPGEELHKVVLRTQRRELDADGVTGRFLLPPRTTVVEAERHGVLDASDGRPDPLRYSELAARDGYSLHLDAATQIDPGDPNGTDDDPDEGTSSSPTRSHDGCNSGDSTAPRSCPERLPTPACPSPERTGPATHDRSSSSSRSRIRSASTGTTRIGNSSSTSRRPSSWTCDSRAVSTKTTWSSSRSPSGSQAASSPTHLIGPSRSARSREPTSAEPSERAAIGCSRRGSRSPSCTPSRTRSPIRHSVRPTSSSWHHASWPRRLRTSRSRRGGTRTAPGDSTCWPRGPRESIAVRGRRRHARRWSGSSPPSSNVPSSWPDPTAWSRHRCAPVTITATRNTVGSSTGWKQPERSSTTSSRPARSSSVPVRTPCNSTGSTWPASH